MQVENNGPAFDAVAAGYDDSFTDSAVGRAQREQVWHFLTEIRSRHQIRNVLECNCGTGVDAQWLAGQGLAVVATDASPQMIAVTRTKVLEAGLQPVKTAVCTLQELHWNETVVQGAPYDLLFSNFGGLNCLSPEEIRQWNDQLRTLITDKGLLILVVMSRFSWWETLYFLLKGKPRAAFRRLSRKPVEARLDANTTIPTWYYGPTELSGLLPDYRVKKCAPVGFWLTPSYLDPFFRRRPGWLRLLNRLEKKSAAAWLAPAADHFFLLLERKKSAI